MLLLGCCFLGFSACGVVVTFVVWGSFVVFGFLVLLIGLLFLFLLMVLMLYGFFSSGGFAFSPSTTLSCSTCPRCLYRPASSRFISFYLYFNRRYLCWFIFALSLTAGRRFRALGLRLFCLSARLKNVAHLSRPHVSNFIV